MNSQQQSKQQTQQLYSYNQILQIFKQYKQIKYKNQQQKYLSQTYNSNVTKTVQRTTNNLVQIIEFRKQLQYTLQRQQLKSDYADKLQKTLNKLHQYQQIIKQLSIKIHQQYNKSIRSMISSNQQNIDRQMLQANKQDGQVVRALKSSVVGLTNSYVHFMQYSSINRQQSPPLPQYQYDQINGKVDKDLGIKIVKKDMHVNMDMDICRHKLLQKQKFLDNKQKILELCKQMQHDRKQDTARYEHSLLATIKTYEQLLSIPQQSQQSLQRLSQPLIQSKYRNLNHNNSQQIMKYEQLMINTKQSHIEQLYQLSERIKQLQQQLNVLSISNQQLTTALKSQQERWQQRQAEITNKHRRIITELQHKLNSIRQNLVDKQKKLIKLGQSKSQTGQQNNKLQQRVQQLMGQISQMGQINSNYQLQVKQLQAHILTDKQESQLEIQNKTNQILTLKQNYDITTARLNQQISQLNKANSECVNKMQQQTDKIEWLNKLITNKNKQFSRYKQAAEQSEKCIRIIAEQATSLQQSILRKGEQLQRLIVKYENRINEMSVRVEKLIIENRQKQNIETMNRETYKNIQKQQQNIQKQQQQQTRWHLEQVIKGDNQIEYMRYNKSTQSQNIQAIKQTIRLQIEQQFKGEHRKLEVIIATLAGMIQLQKQQQHQLQAQIKNQEDRQSQIKQQQQLDGDIISQ